MRNTLIAVLCVIAIVNAHMWIYEPNPNRFGPNGGTSGLSNTGGSNPGNLNARSGNSANPCGGVAFNANNAERVTAPATFTLRWIQTDVGNSWDVYLAAQPDNNLISNKLTTVAGATNTQHSATLTFNTAGNFTAQVAVTNGGSGFISCADFIVSPAPSSGSSGDNGAASSLAPLAVVIFSAILALF